MGWFDSDPGGMFGSSLIDPSGAIDPEQYAAARRNAGMLGLAQGLLASSGASRLPVTFGAALGNGLQGYIGGQKAFSDDALNAAKLPYLRAQTQESVLKQGLTQAQIDQLRQQLSLGKLAITQATNSANQPPPTIDQVLGGGQPAAPAAVGGAALGPNSPIGDDFVDRIVANESGGDPNAKNPRSSATGPGQFIDSTWLNVARSHFPDLVGNASDADLLAMRGDTGFSRKMVAAYGQDNAKALSDAGIPVNHATLYAAHFLGPGGAVKVLSADPNTPLANLLGPDVIRANPNLAGLTVGKFAATMAAKMGADARPVQVADASGAIPQSATMSPATGSGSSVAPSSRDAVPGLPVKTNALGEKYQYDPDTGWHLVGNALPLDQAIAKAAALRPGMPGYAATRGPGNDAGINIDPSTRRPLAQPVSVPLAPSVSPATAAPRVTDGDNGQPFTPGAVPMTRDQLNAQLLARTGGAPQPGAGIVPPAPQPGSTLSPAGRAVLNADLAAGHQAASQAQLYALVNPELAKITWDRYINSPTHVMAQRYATNLPDAEKTAYDKHLELTNGLALKGVRQGPNGSQEQIPGAADVMEANALAEARGKNAPQQEREIAVANNQAMLARESERLKQIGEAGMKFEKGFDPNTGLPGYFNARGEPMATGGKPVIAENPYKAFQEKEIETAAQGAQKAREYRRLGDEFVAAYQNIDKPGYGQQSLQEFRKIQQQFYQLTGQPVPEELAKTTSANEAANFIGQQLVAAASKDMSPRVALGLAQMISKVKMSPTMTPQGVQGVRSLIYGATQEPIERGPFTSEYYNSPQGRLRNDASTAFDTEHPIGAYAVIGSGADPAYITRLRDIAKSGDADKLGAARAQFDRRFGTGAAAQVLGK